MSAAEPTPDEIAQAARFWAVKTFYDLSLNVSHDDIAGLCRAADAHIAYIQPDFAWEDLPANPTLLRGWALLKMPRSILGDPNQAALAHRLADQIVLYIKTGAIWVSQAVSDSVPLSTTAPAVSQPSPASPSEAPLTQPPQVSPPQSIPPLAHPSFSTPVDGFDASTVAAPAAGATASPAGEGGAP